MQLETYVRCLPSSSMKITPNKQMHLYPINNMRHSDPSCSLATSTDFLSKLSTASSLALQRTHPVNQNALTRRVGHPAIITAFTLVEVLIVVVMLAILVSMGLPRYLNSLAETRQNRLLLDLKTVRSQLELYRQEHASFPSNANFVNQMTLASDIDGNTAAPGTAGYPHGSYLFRIPTNPFTSQATIGNGVVGSSDWYYDEATGAFHANDSATTRAY